MFSVNSVINNDQTIQPLRYISKQVKFIAKMFHGKRIKKFKKKVESQAHEPFSIFHRYLELTFCQMK